MSDPSPTSQWETFLRTTRRRVSRPANDHDRAVNGAGRTALLDQVDALKDLEKRVRKAVRSRVEILTSEERDLRVLSKAKTKEVVRECEVIIDARQGGVLLIRDIETKAVVFGPRPLNTREREVFASTKSQPGLFDAVGVNEELAKKLNLMEYLADDAPMSMEERIAHALAAGDLPEEVKAAILLLDESDDEPTSEKKPKATKEPKEPGRRGRKKKGAEPAVIVEPTPAPVAAPDEQPGPAKAEKDAELPKAPPVKKAASDPADAAVSEVAITGEATFGAVPFRYRDVTPTTPDAGGYEVSITLYRADNSIESIAMLLAVCDTAASEPLVVPTLGAPVWMKAVEWPRVPATGELDEELTFKFIQTVDETEEAPEAVTHVTEGTEAAGEPSDAAADDEALEGLPETEEPAFEDESDHEETDAPSEAHDHEEEPGDPAEDGSHYDAFEPRDSLALPDDAPGHDAEPSAAASDDEATPGPAEEPIVDEAPPAPEPAPAVPPVTAPAEKKSRSKKKEEPIAAAEPAVSIDNHFGLSPKLAEQASAGIERAAARTVYFESTAVAQTEEASRMKLTAAMGAAIVPILRHLAATGKLTRRQLGADAAYFRVHAAPKANELTDALVESAIAAHAAK